MSGLYAKGRERFLTGQLSWLTDDIRAVLIDAADYTVNLASHEYLSDIPSAARVATSGTLASKTAAGGVADAADLTIPAVTGDIAEALVLFKYTGTDSTSPLIVYIDTGATGLPVEPNGAAITVLWNNGPTKIFQV